MTCIKTGCVAYLEDYNEWVYGDAFSFGTPYYLSEEGGVLVIRVCYRTRDPAMLAQFGNLRHITVQRVAAWYDEDHTSQARNSTLMAVSPYWRNEGYYGIPEPQLEQKETTDG